MRLDSYSHLDFHNLTVKTTVKNAQSFLNVDYKILVKASPLKPFPINNLAFQISDKYFPFKMSRSNFKYLRMSICRQLSHLYKNNFPPLIDKRKSHQDKWNSYK